MSEKVNVSEVVEIIENVAPNLVPERFKDEVEIDVIVDRVKMFVDISLEKSEVFDLRKITTNAVNSWVMDMRRKAAYGNYREFMLNNGVEESELMLKHGKKSFNTKSLDPIGTTGVRMWYWLEERELELGVKVYRFSKNRSEGFERTGPFTIKRINPKNLGVEFEEDVPFAFPYSLVRVDRMNSQKFE